MRVLGDANRDQQIAGRASGRRRLALASQVQLFAILDPGGNRHGDGFDSAIGAPHRQLRSPPGNRGLEGHV
jgi:hypothetical protein